MMTIFVFSNNSKDYLTGERIIVEACGTDSVFRPDQRKSFFNMKLDAFNYLKQLKGVNKFDYMRAHRVSAYRDFTDKSNAVSDYIKLDYDNSYYLKDTPNHVCEICGDGFNYASLNAQYDVCSQGCLDCLESEQIETPNHLHELLTIGEY